MVRVLRLLLIVSYPFLALSFLMLLGMMFGAAFVSDFTIANRSGRMRLPTTR